MLIATALTAAFTGVLAVLAGVTAWYAYEAFGKQSAQTKTLEAQLADQQALSKKQTPVLVLQEKELKESLKQRKDEADERRRVQASQVFIWEEQHDTNPTLMGFAASVAAKEGHNGPTVIARVRNSSDQPIYAAEFAWHPGNARFGRPNPEPVGTIMPGKEDSRIRVFPRGTNLATAGAVLRFTDAAGQKWLRRPDGQLTEDEQP